MRGEVAKKCEGMSYLPAIVWQMKTKQAIRGLNTLREAALAQVPVVGGIHDFYRYPARFPPGFVAAAIETFSKPGELVLDPFVGGGTSLVEAQRQARQSFGLDINPLAIFVSRAKTALYSPTAIRQVRVWANEVASRMNLHAPAFVEPFWEQHDHFRNFRSQEAWVLRKFMLQARSFLEALSPKPQLLARCAVLRSAQWALDLREQIPSASEFRDYLVERVISMADEAEAYRRNVLTNARSQGVPASALHPTVICDSTDNLDQHYRSLGGVKPSLVITSPPYPGVYVLYHRWKIRARKETPFPFVIANSLDGRGMSHYILGSRQQDGLKAYFDNLYVSFKAISTAVSAKTWLCQIVGFSEPEWQLPRYLDVMKRCGFKEHRLDELANRDDGRLWRSVPGRRWFAKNQSSADPTALEVVLLHRPDLV